MDLCFAQLGNNPRIFRADIGRLAVYMEHTRDGSWRVSIMLAASAYTIAAQTFRTREIAATMTSDMIAAWMSPSGEKQCT